MVTNGLKTIASTLVVSTSLTACGGGGVAGVQNSDAAVTLPASYVLKWSDEFSADGALSAGWTYDLGAPLLGASVNPYNRGSVWGNAELQYYTQDAQNVRAENGNLVIQAVAGLPYGAPTDRNLIATSARVTTDTQAFYDALNPTPYGFYEIRAQIPCEAGAWPAIWMMGRTGNWPARGELDIMEWFGRHFANQPNQVQSAVHTTQSHGATVHFDKLAYSGLCQGFHKFQLHWQPNAVTFGVDGQHIYTYSKPVQATFNNWPFDQPAYLLLNVAVGGNLGGDLGVHFDLSDIPNMRMLVDYVKVWQP